MTLTTFLTSLGPAIEDAYEESMLLPAAHSRPLGMHSPRDTTVTLQIHSQTITLRQSPSVLSSSLPGGTTGAVLWSVTPRFARWLTAASSPLFEHGVLTASSRVLELGCGAAALLACTLGPRVGCYVQSDQRYVMKLAAANVAENVGAGKRAGIVTMALDWEVDELRSQPEMGAVGGPLDVVVACDVVYNEGLVQPFLDTVREACLFAREPEDPGRTAVVVAMELRSQDVLEVFLEAFLRGWDVWRVPEGGELGEGYAVFVGVLKRDG